jgi:DsbE subfamily thiol:disulfide oxidoreductase
LPSPLIGKPAPAFDLTDVLDPGAHVSNAALKGQVYVFNVWGTWCVACREEHEELLAIAQQRVVPIIGLDYMDQRDKAQQWLQQLGNPYTAVAFDHDGARRSTGACTARPKPSWSTAADASLQVHFAHDARSLAAEFLPRIAAARRSGA